jgi:hypothetical protein
VPSSAPSAWGSGAGVQGISLFSSLLRQLGLSAACTGSPAAGDCDSLGDTGPDTVRLPPSEQPLAAGPFKLRSRGRCPGPITLLCQLGRSAACTGSPAAGDSTVSGIPGRMQSCYLPPSRHGPLNSSSWAAFGPSHCQWDLAPGRPHGSPRLPGVCPVHRGR